MLQVQRSHKTEDTTDVKCDNIQREAHTVPGSEEVFKVPPSFPFAPLFPNKAPRKGEILGIWICQVLEGFDWEAHEQLPLPLQRHIFLFYDEAS